MKITILTSNSLRHKFIANTVASQADETIVVSECVPQASVVSPGSESSRDSIAAHFKLRDQTEQTFFGDHATFHSPTLPVVYKEANSLFVYETLKRFKPDLALVFGASIISEPLLSLIPKGRFLNLHLGLSPYYRGSGTNFWPFVNGELGYVGATLLHLDAGIDTGDILAHVRPSIEGGDNVHTVGCKTIQASGRWLVRAVEELKAGKPFNRIAQWAVTNERYYKKIDFNEAVLDQYYVKLKNGLVESYLRAPTDPPRLIDS
jgi:phosphoribosylglycinamide formyltransferase-1